MSVCAGARAYVIVYVHAYVGAFVRACVCVLHIRPYTHAEPHHLHTRERAL